MAWRGACAYIMAYSENVMSCWLGRPRLVNAGGVMEHNFGGLDQSNLLQCIIEDFELLNRQVPIDFNYYAFDADASGRAPGHVDH